MIYWDPNPDCFIIPILNWPIKWYGILFALGFAIGFSIFEGILYRYFLQRPDFQANEIIGQVDLQSLKLDPAVACVGISKEKIERFKQDALDSRCQNPDRVLARLCWEERYQDALWSLKRKAFKITDRITLYMVIATTIGARLGHFVFYEKPSEYLRDPLALLRTWEGGLASHGAAMAIILALALFSRFSKKIDSGLTMVRLLDFICIPTALAGALIRLGNFINQEILGTRSDLPWAVIFGHPADGSFPVPRHPVQLYEACFYLIVFITLWRLSFQRRFLQVPGGLIGLFLILVFGFRFLVEFFKLEQSSLLSAAAELTMGQFLSVPLIILGLLYLRLFYVSATKSAR